MNDGTPPLAVDAAYDGLHEAIRRFTKAQGPALRPELVFPSALEALFWVRVLDEQFSRNDATYRERRDMDADGQVLHGVRWARNAATHELAMPFSYRDGISWPITFPTTWGDFVWHETAAVPGSATDKKGRTSYEQHLSGQALKHTLSAGERWLDREMKCRASG